MRPATVRTIFLILSAITAVTEDAMAAVFTPYTLTEHAGEEHLDTIIAPYLAQGFVRYPDDAPQIFHPDDWLEIIVAWEDWGKDRDYNDLIIHLVYVMPGLSVWSEIGHNAGNLHAFSLLDNHSFALAITSGCCPGGPFRADELATAEGQDPWDPAVIWVKPKPEIEPVPEASSLLLLGTGTLLFLFWRKR